MTKYLSRFSDAIILWITNKDTSYQDGNFNCPLARHAGVENPPVQTAIPVFEQDSST